MAPYSMKQSSNNKDQLVVTTTAEAADEKDAALSPEERARRDEVVPYLLVRAYHLPGNTYAQDWIQYMVNNHPLFGVCFHHQYHPVRRNVRILSMVGSILFGLSVTNIIYLAFVFTDADYDTAYVTVEGDFSTGQDQLDSQVTALSVTNGNLALWTIGATLHALYDNVIWALAACTCCITEQDGGGGAMSEAKMQRYRGTSTLLVFVSVIVVTALCTLAVTIRAAVDRSDDPEKVYASSTTGAELWRVDAANDFEFVLAYLVELALTYFIYYPVVGTILFTGVLTCGRWPTVGGRPFEMKQAAAQEDELREGHEFAMGDVERPANFSSAKGKAAQEQPASKTPIQNKPVVAKKTTSLKK